MRTIERSAKKVVIEVTKDEIRQRGFDAFWDEVRVLYPTNLYEIDTIETGDKVLTLKLKLQKY